MKTIQCMGIVGRYETPTGLLTFYDTGVIVPPADMAELLTLHKLVLSGKLAEVGNKIFPLMRDIAHKANVYPKGYASVAEDGRIFVTEPFYEAKEEG